MKYMTGTPGPVRQAPGLRQPYTQNIAQRRVKAVLRKAVSTRRGKRHSRVPHACGLVGILLHLPPGPANDVYCAVRTPAADPLLRALLEVKGLRPTEAEPAFGQAPCGRVVGTSSCERHCPVVAFLWMQGQLCTSGCLYVWLGCCSSAYRLVSGSWCGERASGGPVHIPGVSFPFPYTLGKMLVLVSN